MRLEQIYYMIESVVCQEKFSACTGGGLVPAQEAAQPAGKGFFNEKIAELGQENADSQRNGNAQKGKGREGGKVKNCPVQKHNGVIVNQVQGKADVAKLYQGLWIAVGIQPPHEEAQQEQHSGNAPYQRPAETKRIDTGLGDEQQQENDASQQGAEKAAGAGQFPAAVHIVQGGGNIVGQDTKDKFQHNRISVKGQGGKGGMGQLGGACHKQEQGAAQEPPVPMADVEGEEEEQIKKQLAVYSPAHAHQGLERAVPNVEGDKKQALYQKGRVGPALGKHTGKQEDKPIGAQGHQVIQGQNPDKPFPQKEFCGAVGGKHNHEAAEAEKNIHAESAAV